MWETLCPTLYPWCHLLRAVEFVDIFQSHGIMIMADTLVLLPVSSVHPNVTTSGIMEYFISLDDIVILAVPESSSRITDEVM